MSDHANHSLASALYARSHELLDGQHWTWPQEVEEAALRLLNDPALGATECWPAQRALSIGYATRAAKRKVLGGTTFDDDYLADLAEWYRDDPCMAVSAGALAVRDGLPAAFGAPAEVWKSLTEQAIRDTRRWAEQQLAQVPVGLTDQTLGRAIALGYGLAYSHTAINLSNDSATDDMKPGADHDLPAWGFAGGQANAFARELIDNWNLARIDDGADAFPFSLLLAYEGHNRLDVLSIGGG